MNQEKQPMSTPMKGHSSLTQEWIQNNQGKPPRPNGTRLSASINDEASSDKWKNNFSRNSSLLYQGEQSQQSVSYSCPWSVCSASFTSLESFDEFDPMSSFPSIREKEATPIRNSSNLSVSSASVGCLSDPGSPPPPAEQYQSQSSCTKNRARRYSEPFLFLKRFKQDKATKSSSFSTFFSPSVGSNPLTSAMSPSEDNPPDKLEDKAQPMAPTASSFFIPTKSLLRNTLFPQESDLSEDTFYNHLYRQKSDATISTLDETEDVEVNYRSQSVAAKKRNSILRSVPEQNMVALPAPTSSFLFTSEANQVHAGSGMLVTPNQDFSLLPKTKDKTKGPLVGKLNSATLRIRHHGIKLRHRVRSLLQIFSCVRNGDVDVVAVNYATSPQ